MFANYTHSIIAGFNVKNSLLPTNIILLLL